MSILKQLEAKYGKVRKTNRGFSLISCGNNFIVPIKDNFNVNFCYPISNMLVITAVNDNNKKLAGTHTWENVTCDPDKLLNFIDYYVANCKRSDIGYIDKNNRIVTKEKAINDWKKSLKENGIQSIEKGDSLVCSYNNNKVVLEIPKDISNDFSLYCNSCSEFFENGKEVLNYLNKVSDYKEILKDKINKIEEDSKIKVVKTSKPLMYELRGYGAKAIIRFDKNKLNFYYKSVREDEFDKYTHWSYLEEDKAGKLLRKVKRDNILYKEDGTAYYANEIKLDLSGEKDFEKIEKILKNLGIYASTFSSKSRKTLYLNFNYNGKKYNIISNKGKYSIEYKDLYTWDAYSTIKKNISFDSVVKWINETKKKVQSSVNLNKYLYNGELITASSKQEAIKQIIASTKSNSKDYDETFEYWLSNVVNLMNYKTNNEHHYTSSFFRNKKNVREAFKKYDVEDGAKYLLHKYPRY